jgi:hypothetical protein
MTIEDGQKLVKQKGRAGKEALAPPKVVQQAEIKLLLESGGLIQIRLHLRQERGGRETVAKLLVDFSGFVILPR